MKTAPPSDADLDIFSEALEEFRYDFERLAYILWPFGEKDHELEHMQPYNWQRVEWRKLSAHLKNPATRYAAYRLIISSGNGAAKTAFGSMTMIMLLYTQRLRARVTANTDPQIKTVVWPEVDKWFRMARFNDVFFEKFGTSIKSRNEKLADGWRIDTVTWSEQSPASISGLHNKGGAMMYYFEEAPGIPAVIWDYASGAFTETETIKIWMAFGNSDDPESKFEQNMTSPSWRAVRLDTRQLSHIAKDQIASWLADCGGNEDHDDFRVRVRGLPRKSSQDSIITRESVDEAIKRAETFDVDSVKSMPCILSCDPAWRGGDEVCIWYRQGGYVKMLEKYKLNKAAGQDHQYTYMKLCEWERELAVDAVNIDQGEGTGILTLANNAGKTSWCLISFASSAYDAPDFKNSQYGNIRAQMYHEGELFLAGGGAMDFREPEWKEESRKQLCWTKGTRHKVSGKKMAEPKGDIKTRVGHSPDIADGFVLLFGRPVFERLPENDRHSQNAYHIGQTPYQMPEHQDPYETLDADFTVYN